ncbi:MAG: hypothetical protein PHC91_03320 [Eubacteriales bacterium]|nr:hypothetical protein [Eubacteriales bacterium]
MDYKNVQSASRKGMRDIPEETNIDYEKENSEEDLKKLGRQVEV